MNFRKVNNLAGWIVCAIASLVYILTTEMRGSFWDCGEFVAACYKVQLPHPPGAPLFVMLGRFFIILFGDNPMTAAKAVNIMNALASGFTILFLFWTITHFARKLMTGNTAEPTGAQTVTVIGAGIVGALAYTFSDSFWYSAVEGEVYALSSLFTALAFWAILKWERADDLAGNDRQARNRADRWIVFLFFSLGLSIGIHLLGLLVIPAAVMTYYFKRYTYTRKGAIWAFILGCVITGVVQVAVIQWTVKIAGRFDIFFVNGFSLPFFSGFAFFFVLLGVLVWFGLRHAQRKNYSFLRLGLWCFIFMMLGYSPYVTTMMRSTANPGLDMNNVDNPMSLVYYLSREQYGSQPLLYGPHFLASPTDSKEKTSYVKSKEGYQKLTQYENAYDSKDMQLFPRMWDNSEKSSAYIDWINMDAVRAPFDGVITNASEAGVELTGQGNQKQLLQVPDGYAFNPLMRSGQVRAGFPMFVKTPNVADNIRWFMSYQMGFMYWRYFMWNFAGKQNDLQGFGNRRDGNWKTGIGFMDNMRLGNQDMLPESIKHNKENNSLFLLPFIFGVIGCVYQFLRNRKDWIVTFLLFFFTGIAIVVYLNQPGSQPRERDYAFAGSFYAYAIWIGLAVVGLVRMAREARDKVTQKDMVVYTGVITTIVMLLSDANSINGGSFVVAVLGGVMASAIAFIASLIINKVMGDETDGGLRKAGFIATAICLIAPVIMGMQEWDDHDRSKKLLAPDLGRDYLESCPQNAILFTFGDNDTYPLWYAQEVEGVRPDLRIVNTSLLGIDWYVNQLRYKVNESAPFAMSWTEDQIRGFQFARAIRDQSNSTQPLKEWFTSTLLPALNGENKSDVRVPFPARFSVPVDVAYVKSSGQVKANDAVLPEVTLDVFGNGGMTLDQLTMLNIIANNNWRRPVCFTSPYSEVGFGPYLRAVGLVHQLVPVITTQGGADSDVEKNQELLMNVFRAGNANVPGVYFDEENRRHLNSLRLTYALAALRQATSGNQAAAKALLGRAESQIGTEALPYAMVSRDNMHNRMSATYLEAAVLAGDSALAQKVRSALIKDLNEQKRYYDYLREQKPDFYNGDLMGDEYWTQQLLDRLTKQAPAPVMPMQELPQKPDSADTGTRK